MGGDIMNLYKWVAFCLLVTPITAHAKINLDDFVYWYPEAIDTVFTRDYLSEKELFCFQKYKETVWEPTPGYTMRTFGYMCMRALDACQILTDETAAGCAEMAIALGINQERIAEQCKNAPNQSGCDPIDGTPCNQNGALIITDNTSDKDSSSKRYICENNKWKRQDQTNNTIKSITEQTLQIELYARCVNKELAMAFGGEIKRHYDCDTESRNCLIAIETGKDTQTATWLYCGKLMKDGSVACYSGPESMNGTIETLKNHLKLHDRCKLPSWAND